MESFTPQLTYDHGKFSLRVPLEIDKLKKFTNVGRWTTIGKFEYQTDSSIAAKRFWRYADSNADRVLKRYFVKRYLLPDDFSLPDFLDPHQVTGITWALTRARTYLAHAPGAGKTLQALIIALWAMRLSEKGAQALIIVPPTLTRNWVNEITKWLTEKPELWKGEIILAASIIPDSTHQELADWNAPFLICPDSMLTREWVYQSLLRMRKAAVIVDEASRFKEADSIRTKHLFGTERLPGLIHDARHAVLLDGSPMMNRSMELWAPTYAMAPFAIDYMNQEEFGHRYCGARFNADKNCWEYKFNSHQEELHKKLTKNFMHVVTEDELHHPERLRSLVYMTRDPRSKDMREWELKNVKTILKSLNKSVDERESHGTLASYRRQIGVKKVPWVVSYVKDLLSQSKDERILIFAWHREVCDALFEALQSEGSGIIMGGYSKEHRERVFDAFQNGRIRTIVGNIAAMGRGHNLQSATRVVFAEYSWTDELNKQCEKRTSRKGSNRTCVRCDYIVCPDSIDERVLTAIFKKTENVKRVIG